MISKQPMETVDTMGTQKARDGRTYTMLQLQDEEIEIINNLEDGEERVTRGESMQLQKQQKSIQPAIIHSTTIGFSENLLLHPGPFASDSNFSIPPEKSVEIPGQADINEYDDYKDTNFRDAFAALMSDPDYSDLWEPVNDLPNTYSAQDILNPEDHQYHHTKPLAGPVSDSTPESPSNPPHTQPNVYTQLARVYSSSVEPCTIFNEVIDPESGYHYTLHYFPPNPHPSISWDQRFINFNYRLRQRGMLVYNQYPIPIFCLTPEGSHGAIPATIHDKTRSTGFWARNSMPGGYQRRMIAFVSGRLRERNWWSWIVKSAGEYIYELPVGMPPLRYNNLEEAAERISEWRPGMKGWTKYHNISASQKILTDHDVTLNCEEGDPEW